MEQKHLSKDILSGVDRVMENIESYIMSIGLLLISAIVFSNVIARYFFGASFAWSEELSRYIIVWVTFIGMSSCARHDAHVKVDLLANILKGKSKWIHEIVINLIMVLLSAYMVYISFGFTITQFKGGNTSVAIAIPVWLIYVSTVIGFAFCTLTYMRRVYITIANGNIDNMSEAEFENQPEV